MTNRMALIEWAKSYCGDPASHTARGAKIREFMVEEGLRPGHRVLDIGCGALSQGAALITYVDSGNYVGLDPNGWLIEAALMEWPQLLDRRPEFSYSSEFDVTSFEPFDYIISHSVMSHMAHWQMEQALLNIRRSANEGAIWLSSLRLDQYDLCAANWVYPGVSYFRKETVQTLGYHAGWMVEQIPGYTERLTEVAPNDFHHWIRLRASIPTDEANRMRMRMEERLEEQRELSAATRHEWEEQEATRVRELTRMMASGH